MEPLNISSVELVLPFFLDENQSGTMTFNIHSGGTKSYLIKYHILWDKMCPVPYNVTTTPPPPPNDGIFFSLLGQSWWRRKVGEIGWGRIFLPCLLLLWAMQCYSLVWGGCLILALAITGALMSFSNFPTFPASPPLP